MLGFSRAWSGVGGMRRGLRSPKLLGTAIAAVALGGPLPAGEAQAQERYRRDRDHNHDHSSVEVDFSIGTRYRPVLQRGDQFEDERPDRVWCEPVYRTVCAKVWIEPKYRTVCEKVWVEPVVRDVCERAWVPARYEERVRFRRDRHGHRVRVVERVCVEPGHFQEAHRQVVVREGYFKTVERQELVCAGHWKTVERQEFVTPGRWEYRRDGRPVRFERDRGFEISARIEH